MLIFINVFNRIKRFFTDRKIHYLGFIELDHTVTVIQTGRETKSVVVFHFYASTKKRLIKHARDIDLTTMTGYGATLYAWTQGNGSAFDPPWHRSLINESEWLKAYKEQRQKLYGTSRPYP